MENSMADTIIQLLWPFLGAGDRVINKILEELGRAAMEIIKHRTTSYSDFKIQLNCSLLCNNILLPSFSEESLAPLRRPALTDHIL